MTIDASMGWGGDYYTQMLCQQMMQNGAGATAKGTNGGSGNDGAATQKQGVGLLGTGAAALGGAGATYAGMNWLNHKFNSPVEEVKGKVQFTEDFMHRFSGEYAALQNESAVKNFYTNLSKEIAGKAKFEVNAENYESLMEEFRSFMNDPGNPKVADMSDDLKGFLNQRLGKDVVPAGTTVTEANRHLYEVVDGDLATVKGKYAEIFHEANGLEFKNNYNLQKQVYESYDDVLKGLKNCKTATEKAEYIRSNPHAFNLDVDDWKKIFSGSDAEIETVFNKIKADTGRKAALKSGYTSIEKNMQRFAKQWDGKCGFFGKGKFNVFSKKTASALDNALSSMRSAKGGKYAIIGAAAAAVGCLLYNA